MSQVPPRFLSDHRVYVLDFPADEDQHGDALAALAKVRAIHARYVEVCDAVSEVARSTPGIEIQMDDFVCVVKGPRESLDSLLSAGFVHEETIDDEQTPEELLMEDLVHLLSQKPLKFEAIVSSIEDMMGWSSINPEWIRYGIDDLVEKGWVERVDDEYVVPFEDDDSAEKMARSARHEEMYASAERLGEPASSIVRGLIDEIYGEGPLEN